MFDCAIIGSGPAGLAATVFAVRKGIDVRLITGKLGGKTTLSVNFPEMDDYVVLKAKEQVQVYRAQVEYLSHILDEGYLDRLEERGTSFALTLRGGGRIEARYLIVATGTRAPALDIPGESRFFGKALGSSAISYSHMLRDRSVCIVGNSDRAVEAAVECSSQATRVCLVLEPHASYSHRALALANEREEITTLNGYSVISIDGDEWARSLTIRRGDVESESNREKTVEADAFFIEREPSPNSDLLADLVRRDSRGAIIVDTEGRSSHPRIFAAGDVASSGMEQILIALGDGTRAALSVYRELTRKDLD